MKNFFLILSGILFDIFGTLHLVRYFLKWPVVIGSFQVPLVASLYVTGACYLISAGCFVARGRGKNG